MTSNVTWRGSDIFSRFYGIKWHLGPKCSDVFLFVINMNLIIITVIVITEFECTSFRYRHTIVPYHVVKSSRRIFATKDSFSRLNLVIRVASISSRSEPRSMSSKDMQKYSSLGYLWKRWECLILKPVDPDLITFQTDFESQHSML